MRRVEGPARTRSGQALNKVALTADQTRISPLALGLFGLWFASGAVLAVFPDVGGPAIFAFVLLGWLASVVLHEYAHARTAFWAGDYTVAERGYLTLDPVRYFKLDLSLILPVIAILMGGIGFPGGAVYLREGLMASKAWRSLVSLAGPIATLLVAVALGILALLSRWADLPALTAGLAFLAMLEASAFILNLLPIPGFDGYGALRPYLPERFAKGMRLVEQWSMVIVLLLLFQAPMVWGFIRGVSLMISLALGFSIEEISQGIAGFFFWKA